MLARMWKQRNTSVLVGVKTCAATVTVSVKAPQKVRELYYRIRLCHQ